MPDFRIITLFSTTLLLAWLGIIVYRRSREHLIFSFFVWSVTLWSLALGIFYTLNTSDAINFLGRMVYVFGSIIPVLFFEFSLAFTKKRVSWLEHAAILLPSAALTYIYLFTPLVIQQVFAQGMLRGYSYGSGRMIFDLHLGLFFVAGFLTLYLNFPRVRGTNQYIQYQYIIVGTLIGVILSTATNVALPWFGRFELLWAGPIGGGIWTIVMTYGISRHRLMDVKVITTEIFVGIIWLVLFINITVFSSVAELIFNIFLFLAVLFFGYFLVRSVRKEVEQREELERLSQELSTANQKLQMLDQAKSEFISIASHQLRTPLTIIRGYVSLVLEGTLGPIGEQGKDALYKVERSAIQLVKLVSDLLNLSRIESGKIKYDFAKEDLIPVITQVVGEFQPSAEKKHLAFEFENKFGPAVFAFDRDKMREVAVNLIDNAIKYSPKNGKVSVLLERGSNPETLRFAVMDSGMGIKQADINRLFSKFIRTEEAQKEDPNGMGIGLYFVKRVVEDHHGRVGAVSAGIGRGSTFFAEFPIKAAA